MKNFSPCIFNRSKKFFRKPVKMFKNPLFYKYVVISAAINRILIAFSSSAIEYVVALDVKVWRVMQLFYYL
jgi:hypothetical protein